MEAALVTLLGILVAGILTGVGWIVRLVFKHEATDATLINEVKNLGGRLDRVDTRFDRVDTRLDRLEEKLVTVIQTLARIEQKIAPPDTPSTP